ncbi:MAG: hypothetical protein K8S27_03855 [Candidatus Omnitrophica bacterium]|nr:hypothetical protein [Candidatus Omnitrophota bacterium]
MRRRIIIQFIMRCRPIILLILLLTVFHRIPQEQKDIVISKKIEYGTYGLPFTRMPPKTKKRIIFLGNSVLQTTDVITRIEALKEEYPAIDFEIGNFSMCGSSIADYILMYNYIKKYNPDLIIAHVMPVTFGYDLPLFRTEAKKLIFLPEMKEIWAHEIFDLYSRDELVESFLYSFFPVFRKHIIIRVQCKNMINKFTLKIGAFPIMSFFPYTLNTAGDWMKSNRMTSFNQVRPKEQPVLSGLLLFFLNQISEHHQKFVFVEQENNLMSLPISDNFSKIIEKYDEIFYYDFSHYYKKNHYVDSIHPASSEEKSQMALRLYNIIIKHLQNN